MLRWHVQESCFYQPKLETAGLVVETGCPDRRTVCERDGDFAPAASSAVETLWYWYFIEVMMLVDQGRFRDQNNLFLGRAVQIGNLDHSVTDHSRNLVFLTIKRSWLAAGIFPLATNNARRRFMLASGTSANNRAAACAT